MSEKEKPHEWDFFARIEELEELWVKQTDDVDKLEGRLNDAFFMGLAALALVLRISINGHPIPDEFLEKWIKRFESIDKTKIKSDYSEEIIEMLKIAKNKGKREPPVTKKSLRI